MLNFTDPLFIHPLFDLLMSPVDSTDPLFIHLLFDLLISPVDSLWIRLLV